MKLFFVSNNYTVNPKLYLYTFKLCMLKYNLLFFILFVILSLSSKGQSYYYKNYTVDKGLPSSEIFQVLQDKRGYVWIATNQGVSRYNGYEFQNFDIQDGLPENTILSLFEDYKGRIWFVSMLGKLSWFENDSIYEYKYNTLIEKFDYKKFHSMKKSFYVDSLNQVYIGFYNSDLIKITKDGKLSKIESLNKKNTTILQRMSENDVIYNYNGITSYFELNNFDNPTLFVEVDKKETNYLRIMANYSKNCFIYSRLNTLFVFDSIGNYVFKEFDNQIIWMSEDNKGFIWLGFLDAGAKAFSDEKCSNKVFEILKGKSVTSVFQDTEGGYWFSTLANGLYYFPTLEIKSLTQDNGLETNYVNEIEAFNNEIWIGGDNKTIYSFDFNRLKSHQFLSAKRLECKLIKTFNDSLIIGFGGKSSEKVFLIKNKQIIWKQNFNCREAIKSGSNILFFEKTMSKWTGNKLYSQIKVIPEYLRIHSVIKFTDNLLWIGTENGLRGYALDSQRSFKIEYNDLLNNRINCMLKDDDVVWIGTKGAGLLKLKEQNVFQYTMNNGLPGNSVNAIEKKDSVLWLATNNGIAKFYIDSLTKDNNKIEIFSKANGMLGIEIYDIALLNDYIFAGTNKGVSYFRQDLSGINKAMPNIYFTQVKILNKDTVIRNYYELEHDQNYIEFNFTGISYQREKGLQYAYMLEGINSDWVKTINRSVSFPSLPPGNYKFKVKVYNRSGIESKTKSITFKISKAIYQTLWFKISVITILLLVIALIFVVFFFTKMKEIKKRNSINDELNKYRQRALSAQMNPHFIYNSLNSVQNYIIKSDRIKSSEYLFKFSKLMRKVLENSQKSLITLQEELDALNFYIEMELIRFRNSFNFELIKSDEITLSNYKLPPLMLQPFVENAIHHGLRNKMGEKNLVIKLFKKNENICIHIIDNGIGRKEALRIKKKNLNTYKSYGTEITEKRFHLFKELYKDKVKLTVIDITSDDGLCEGTRVEIELV